MADENQKKYFGGTKKALIKTMVASGILTRAHCYVDDSRGLHCVVLGKGFRLTCVPYILGCIAPFDG
jgi:hypothetical protein